MTLIADVTLESFTCANGSAAMMSPAAATATPSVDRSVIFFRHWGVLGKECDEVFVPWVSPAAGMKIIAAQSRHNASQFAKENATNLPCLDSRRGIPPATLL